jgi:hypothetical protein
VWLLLGEIFSVLQSFGGVSPLKKTSNINNRTRKRRQYFPKDQGTMPTKPLTFRPPGAPTSRDVERAYDKRRGTAHARGYTDQLRRRMAAFRAARPLCLGCQAVGRIAATEVCDHVIPARGDRDLLWSEANWQPACREHHDIIKQRLEDMWNARTITSDELRLDSATAIRLTRDLLA